MRPSALFCTICSMKLVDLLLSSNTRDSSFTLEWSGEGVRERGE